MSNRTRWTLAIVLTALTPLASYGLARLGEPSSHWLWHLLRLV